MSEEPHVAQVIAQLREAAAKKCWPCACLHQSLAAIERAIPNAKRPADLDAALNAARERLTAVKYECLGCQVCLPACTVTRLSNHPSGSTPPSFVAYGGRHWMSRVVLFICALMQAQVIVSVALSPTTICPERCDDDGADGRCPPACLSWRG